MELERGIDPKDMRKQEDERERRTRVTYQVGTQNGPAQEFTDVVAAAKAFHRAKADEQPYIFRMEARPDGRESGQHIGQTTMTEYAGKREYGKWVGQSDHDLYRAYYAERDTPHLNAIMQRNYQITHDHEGMVVDVRKIGREVAERWAREDAADFRQIQGIYTRSSAALSIEEPMQNPHYKAAFERADLEAARGVESKAYVAVDVQSKVNRPEFQQESARETVRLYQEAKTPGDRMMWLHDMKYGAEANPDYRAELLRYAPELAAKAGVQARVGAELEVAERRVVAEFYSKANEAFAEIQARHPADQRQAERILDGHMAQLQSALTGAGAKPSTIQGEAQRARSYVEDKFDELGIPHQQQTAHVGRHESLHPVAGRVVSVGMDVHIERQDRSVVAVEAAKLDRAPQVGERVMVTFSGSGNGTVRSLGERAQERAASYDMGR